MTGPTLDDLQRDDGCIDPLDLDPVDVPACTELDRARNHGADDDTDRALQAATARARGAAKGRQRRHDRLLRGAR